jgi:hypothetical protein
MKHIFRGGEGSGSLFSCIKNKGACYTSKYGMSVVSWLVANSFVLVFSTVVQQKFSEQLNIFVSVWTPSDIALCLL